METGKKINGPEGGVFELVKKDKWKFSANIEQNEKNLKSQKADAVAKGEATNDPIFYIKYNQPK